MTADDARAALRAVANPIAETLGDEYLSATIDLHPVAPLPDSYPPQKSLIQLAQELLTPDHVGGVHQTKPVQRWPHTLCTSLQRLVQSTPSQSDPRQLHTEARAIAQIIEQRLGTIRIAGTIQFSGGGYRGCIHEHFLLITRSHLALLTLALDD